MIKLLLIAVAILADQLITASPIDEPSSSNPMINIRSIGFKIHDSIDGTRESVRNVLGYKPDHQVLQTIQNRSDEFLRELKTIYSTINGQAMAFVEPALKELENEITKTAAVISSEDPETAKKAHDYLTTLQRDIQSLVTNTAALGGQIDQEKQMVANEIQDIISKAYLAASETARKTSIALESKK